MKRDEVLEQIQPIVGNQVRNVPDASTTRINVTPDMVTLRPSRGARVIEVDPDGARSMVDFVGLPLGIAKSLNPNTFSQVLSELLHRTGKYSLVLHEDKVISLINYGERRPINPERLLNTIEKAIPVQDYNRVVMLPDQGVSLEIVGEKTQPVRRGDLVRAGVKLNFSPAGTISPMVQSYALRLTCTNGATSNIVLAEFTGGGGEGDQIWQWFRESVRRAYSSFNQVVEGYRNMVKESIKPEDRAALLEALLKKAQIGGRYAEAIRAEALRRPPENTYDLFNLITWGSSHVIEAPRQIQRAQETAAEFADEETHARVCPLCRRSR